MNDPFHAGERAIQERTDERHRALLNGRIISPAIPAAAVRFLAQQEMVVLGWRAPVGEIWAAVLAGRAGFAQASADRGFLDLTLEDDSGQLSASAPFKALRPGDGLGTLFVDLATRRRLRVNGRLTELAADRLTLAVEQASPQCPKYIQSRALAAAVGERSSGDNALRQGTSLTDELREWIGRADTFFVASAHPDGPLDVSHRGGRPGFVRVEREVLRIPDYPGNSMFCTLGNFELNPRAGLCFLDFTVNRQLKLTGEVRLDLAAGDTRGETGGTGRWWEFIPQRWTIAPLNRSIRWTFLDASPFNPQRAPAGA